MVTYILIAVALNAHLPPKVQVPPPSTGGGIQGGGGGHDPRYNGPTVLERLELDSEQAQALWMWDQYSKDHCEAVVEQGRREFAFFASNPSPHGWGNGLRGTCIHFYGLACLRLGLEQEAYKALLASGGDAIHLDHQPELLVMMDELNNGQDDLARDQLAKIEKEQPTFEPRYDGPFASSLPDIKTHEGLMLKVYWLAWQHFNDGEDMLYGMPLADRYLTKCHEIAPDNLYISMEFMEMEVRHKDFKTAIDIGESLVARSKGDQNDYLSWRLDSVISRQAAQYRRDHGIPDPKN